MNPENKRKRDRRRRRRRHEHQNQQNDNQPPRHNPRRSRSRHRSSRSPERSSRRRHSSRNDRQPPRHNPRRSRSRHRSSRSPQRSSRRRHSSRNDRSHHSKSRSVSYNKHRRRRDRSHSRHRDRDRRLARREEEEEEAENDGGSSAAYIVSDSDNENRKRSANDKKRGTRSETGGWRGGSRAGGGGGSDDYYHSASCSSSVDSYRSRRRRRRRSRGSRSERRRGGKKSRRSRSRSHRSSDVCYNSRERGVDKSGPKRRRSDKEGKRREGKGRRSSRNRSDSSRDDTVGHFQGGPGTSIGENYRIVRDVGLGTFGRVVECSRGDNSRVAIKIVRNVRRYYDSALIEADICERVNREQRRHNKDFCAKMLDRFGLSSGHYCLVFERLGRSLYDFLKMNNYKPFPMFCVRDFSRQLLEALDFLHGFGLIHTDLKPENILLCHDDRGPREVPLSTKVKVIDFGGATYDNEKKSSIVNTRQYRAPEVILGYPRWSYPSDLWSAGCIIAELYTGHLLFQTHDNIEHLALMEQACGKFRKEQLENSTSPLARECFDSRGWHRLKGVLSSRSAEHVRETKQIERLVSFDDRPTGLVDLLSSLLKLDPNDRASARQALGSRFFR